MKSLTQKDYDNILSGINENVMGGNFTLFHSYTMRVIEEDARQASIGFVKFEFVLSLIKNEQTKAVVVKADAHSFMMGGVYFAFEFDTRMKGVIIPAHSLFEYTGKAVVMFIDADGRIVGFEVTYLSLIHI